MKITIAQLNPIVGDVRGSLKRVSATMTEFAGVSDLVVFPELFLTGYPPKDLLLRQEFIENVEAAVDKLIGMSNSFPETGILIGSPMPTGKKVGKPLYNSAVLICGGNIVGVQNKSLLPMYDIFDEARYFEPALDVKVIPFKGQVLGITICEDMWNSPELWRGRPYTSDPVQKVVQDGASILINISASPFYAGKGDLRFDVIKAHAVKFGVPFLFVNQVGANEELIFDGGSLYMDASGEAVCVFPVFKEHVETIDTDSVGIPGLYVPRENIKSVHDALVLGIRDYMTKSGFSKALIGLSGGIDSAVACALAKEALGPENVLGIYLASPYSSEESGRYALELARNFNIQFKTIPISQIYLSYLQTLKDELHIDINKKVEVCLQNIQARIRANILMAFSNKYGHLLLTTGNKSETAMGYCTLYGDTAGALAVISDVPKTMVYKLADYINRDSERIPYSIIERLPSAELKPNQFDQDTLPAYDILDKILYYYLEEGYSAKKLQEQGFDAKIVRQVIRMLNKSEYKRKQLAPGLKVTTKSFGTGRRMPLAAKYDF
ncbi:MAG: NAD+ synthase [Candidatus Omnitrophota bacterium]